MGLIWPTLLLLSLVSLGLCLWLMVLSRRRLAASRAETAAVVRRATALGTTLAASPWPQITFSRDGKSPASTPAAAALLGLPGDAPVGEAQVLESLDATGRGRIEPALEALHADAAPFDLEARLAGGHRLIAVHGRPGAEGAVTLWLEDRSEPARREAGLKAEVKHLRAVLDGLPLALWLRDGAGRLTDCNRYYAEAVDSDIETVRREGTELLGRAKAGLAQALAEQARANGQATSETHHVVMGGGRHLVEIFELPHHHLPAEIDPGVGFEAPVGSLGYPHV